MADGFTFRDTHEFWWPVTVRYPTDGGTKESTFEVLFVLVDEDALFEGAPKGEDIALLDVIEADRARLREVVIDWRGVTDETGAVLPCTTVNRDRLLALRPVRLAIGEAYLEAMGLGGERGND